MLLCKLPCHGSYTYHPKHGMANPTGWQCFCSNDLDAVYCDFYGETCHMLPQIKQLSPLMASQIAAGEVVDRPGSVVKELVENGLDAGATSIIIDIAKGGGQCIKITDNGHGMAKDQLTLALSRHATSKIRTIDDLSNVASFGFRGEALASIASVSRLVLTSRVKGVNAAWQIQTIDVTAQADVKQANHPVGTTIEVYDLFYNTPARKKFLKSERAEFGHIDVIIKQFAMVRPDVHFVLKHNQKTIRDLASCADVKHARARLQQCFGAAFVEQAFYHQMETQYVTIEAWLAKPVYSRSSRDQQHLFINQRPVKDAGVSQAMRRAYQDVMPPGRFPAFVLFLTCPTDQIDVNIHPQKQAIKFQHAQAVLKAIFQVIHTVLAKVPFTEDGMSESQTNDHTHTVNNTLHMPRLMQGEQIGRALIDRYAKTATLSMPPKRHQPMVPVLEEVMVERLSSVTSTKPEARDPCLDDMPQDSEILRMPPLGYALGQMHQIYIVAQNEQGMVVVDMHAAHERILYESMKQQYATQGVTMQTLLIPVVLDINEAQLETIEQQTNVLQQLGLDCEPCGIDKMRIRAVPSLLTNADPATLVERVLEELMHHDPSHSVEKQVHALLATMSCHQAIRAHRKLSLDEMNALLRQMEKTDFHGSCNHGRPTYKVFSMKIMDTWFSRGQ